MFPNITRQVKLILGFCEETVYSIKQLKIKVKELFRSIDVIRTLKKHTLVQKTSSPRRERI